MSNTESQIAGRTLDAANTLKEQHRFFDGVFDFLVSIGGAPESLRSDFIRAHTGQSPKCDEYRFQGKLGFGGKYRRKTNRVDCYPEDESPNRLRIIERLNTALQCWANGARPN